jgi:glycosyltransferase involved in cell wall biosynthesis
MEQYTLIQSILTVEKPEISIIMGAIRRERWDRVYDSILKSTRRSFELIIVGPYPLTEYLQEKKNVKYAKDFGSPMRAFNIAAELAEGRLITWHADDGLFLDNSLDMAIDLLYEMGVDEKNVVVAKYFEGEGYSGTDAHPDSYYKLCNAYPRSQYIPTDWWIFNIAIMYRSFFEKLGGFDCQFQSPCIGDADLGIRAQRAGAIVKMAPAPLMTCDHMPDPNKSDHGPIVAAQLQEDEPLYKNIYSCPLDNKPICIDVSNWKNSSTVWRKRF